MIEQYQEPDTEHNPPYPTFDVSLVPTLLDYHCPVWYLELDGTIRAANLLAFWLWGDLKLTGGKLRPTNLLGQNVFTIYSRPSNFNRIELPTTSTSETIDFFGKKLAFVRRLLRNPNYEQSIPFYREFLSALEHKIKDNKPLSDMYETTGEQELEPQWVYSLRIASSSDTRTRPSHFKFIGNINRIYNEGTSCGYIAFYAPVGWTSYYVRDVYRGLHERYDENYVQYQDEEVEQFLTTDRVSIKEGASSIHIQIFDTEEGPLPAQHLTTLVSAFTSLFTKFWLIQQHRVPDLVEYALTHAIFCTARFFHPLRPQEAIAAR